MCFWNIIDEHQKADIGYVLYSGYQGRGVMQEAGAVLFDYRFKTTKPHSVTANVNPDYYFL